MGCGKCERYSRVKMACVEGKANPRTRKATKDTAGIMGYAYICKKNPWRIDLIKEYLNTMAASKQAMMEDIVSRVTPEKRDDVRDTLVRLQLMK